MKIKGHDNALCYLKKYNLIANGGDKLIELYNTELELVCSYNLLEEKVFYIYELMNGRILAVEYNNNVKILEIKNNKIELYKKIETKESKNFVGIEISNKKIICGGENYLSIIEPSLLTKYTLKYSIPMYGYITNIVDLDSSCFLVGDFYNRRITIFSSENYEKIYEINNISFTGNNYSISKISNDLVAIAGEDFSKGCLFFFSIEKKLILKKFYVDDITSCRVVINTINNNLVTLGNSNKNTKDLILLNMEKKSEDIIIKKLHHIKDVYPGIIESLISFDNYFLSNDSLENLKKWEIK